MYIPYHFPFYTHNNNKKKKYKNLNSQNDYCILDFNSTNEKKKPFYLNFCILFEEDEQRNFNYILKGV